MLIVAGATPAMFSNLQFGRLYLLPKEAMMTPKDVRNERKNVRVMLRTGEVENAEYSRPPKRGKGRDYRKVDKTPHVKVHVDVDKGE